MSTTHTDRNLRKRLEIAFRRWILGQSPSADFVSLLRVQDAQRYRAHLEGQFQPGMTWAGHGQTWELDHVVPLSSFNLCDSAQIRLAWSLDNVRPCTVERNKTRGASIADAYLSVLSRTPLHANDYDALRAMTEGQFKDTFPGVRVDTEPS